MKPPQLGDEGGGARGVAGDDHQCHLRVDEEPHDGARRQLILNAESDRVTASTSLALMCFGMSAGPKRPRASYVAPSMVRPPPQPAPQASVWSVADAGGRHSRRPNSCPDRKLAQNLKSRIDW